MLNLKNLDQLPVPVQERYSAYIRKIAPIYSEILLGVHIYGSAVGSSYMPGVSDINSIFVLSQIDFVCFRRSLKIIEQGERRKIVAPLMLTPQYIESSLDVFPLEFAEMQLDHVCVLGSDHLSGLHIRDEHMRLFCEQQIKGRLLRVRQSYLEVGRHRAGIEALLKESLKSLIPALRQMVRLKTGSVPARKEDVLSDCATAFGISTLVLQKVLRDYQADEKIAGRDAHTFVEDFVRTLELLAEQVDNL